MGTYDKIIFGGSFDPVHFGHLITARAAAEHAGASRVVLIPAAGNPLKNSASSDAAHRLEMLELAVDGDDMFDICEHEILQPPPTYTIETVEYLLAGGMFDGRTALVVGADSLDDFPKWRRAAELVELVDIIIACRPPRRVSEIHTCIDAMAKHFSARAVDVMKKNAFASPLIDISSTDIRARVREGKSIRYLTPQKVVQYIAGNELYV